MKWMKFLFTFLVVLLLASCSKNAISTISQGEEVGLVNLSILIGPKGGVKRGKNRQVDSLLLSKLILEVKSDPLTITYLDTLEIREGVGDTSKVYELPIEFDWSVTARIIGNDGLATHASKSTPIDLTTSGSDTVTLYLPAIVSYFKIGFQAPNGGRRAILSIDGVPVDTAYMTTMGEFIELSYPRMEATEEGMLHSVRLDVYGDLMGYTDTLLYRGDTTVIAKSGVEFQAPLHLAYIGPGSENYSDFSFNVQVGIIGNIVFDAKLEEPRIVYLEREVGSKYVSAGNTGVVKECSFFEDGFGKTVYDVKYEMSNQNLHLTCNRAYLVCQGDTLSVIGITQESLQFLSFRDVDFDFYDEKQVQLQIHVKENVTADTTRTRCIRVNGATKKEINISGYFLNGDDTSPWSEVCHLGG